MRRCLLVLTLAALTAAGHDIPNDVTAQIFFKPEGRVLRLLVRVPMKAMRDVDFPQRANGFMDIDRSRQLFRDAAKVWVADPIEVFEDGRKLAPFTIVAAGASLESDKSFTAYETAFAHTTGPPMPSETSVVWNQTLLDVLLETPIQSDKASFSIHSGLARLGLRTVTGLRFLPAGGTLRAFEFEGDPGLLHLDPSWFQASSSFVVEGFWHILGGSDHLLFLACLVIPFRRFRALFPIVTAFTLAHSVTLIASAYGLAPDALWFSPLVETLIAASIVYMAIENVVGVSTVQRRWLVAFVFGLIHGFGFSFALRETLQFAGSHLLSSLVSFNVGIEIGQLLVLILLIPSLEIFFRRGIAERMGTIILSVLIAHTGWHWMLDRGGQLSQYRFEWPEWSAANLAMALRWMAILVALAGVYWWLSRRPRVPQQEVTQR